MQPSDDTCAKRLVNSSAVDPETFHAIFFFAQLKQKLTFSKLMEHMEKERIVFDARWRLCHGLGVHSCFWNRCNHFY